MASATSRQAQSEGGVQVASPTVKLPPNCEAIQPQPGTSVIICAAPKQDLLDKLVTPSVAFSLVAIVLSVWSLRYTKGKDARARQQSIQDDYWLRKVVSPVSIEPFLKFGTELLSKLPDAQDGPDAAAAFGKQRLSELRTLGASFIPLRLLSEDVHTSVETAMDDFEDRLATYMGELDAYFKGQRQDPPSRPEAVTDMSSKLLAVLEPIRQHQAALGYKP